MSLPKRRTPWWARLLIGLVVFVVALVGLVYALTDHPRPVQAAELSCPDSTPTLQAGQPLKVMSWNVQYLAGRGYVFFYDTVNGDGPDTRPTPDSISRTLKEVQGVIQAEQPDLVLLQEVDRDSKRTDYRDELKDLQAGLGGAYPCSASAYYHRASFVPHPKIMGKVGLSLSALSRYRIESATRYQLPRICGDPVTVAFNFKRAVLGVRLPVARGKPLTAFGTHLDAFAQGCNTMQKQVEYIRDLLGQTPAPWIIGGDFNLLATKAAYDRLPELQRTYFNPQTELKILTDKYQSFPTPAQIDSGQGQYISHYPNDPLVKAPDRTIDYYFYSPGLTRSDERIHRDNPKISDHFALLTTIGVP